MNRKPFTPQPGALYINHGGGKYKCIGTPDQTGAVPMMNALSGWILNAHGVGIYDDDSIDWDYSTGGHFKDEQGSRGQYDKYHEMDVLESAIKKFGKQAQVDMMIEEMSELTKALLNERRGREHNITEELADVKIMLLQMVLIFDNAKEVEQISAEKVERLDQRLHDNRDR